MGEYHPYPRNGSRARSRVRISYLGHGLGELLTAMVAQLPVGDIGFSQTFFQLSQSMPYNFGVNSRLLNETHKGFNTGSMRNVYSPDVTCARELVVDRLA